MKINMLKQLNFINFNFKSSKHFNLVLYVRDAILRFIINHYNKIKNRLNSYFKIVRKIIFKFSFKSLRSIFNEILLKYFMF